MPGLYRLYCDSCGYQVKGSMSRTSVVLDGGSEKICGHPGEIRTAEEATGKRWGDLRRGNRIRYRFALACLSCGEMDYYGPSDREEDARTGGHIASIVHQPSPKSVRVYSCRSCGQHALYPICGGTGCLLGLLNLIGIGSRTVACPRCEKGILKSDLYAIS